MSLEELYARPKKTPAVAAAIISKSDFSSIIPQYCAEVCKLKCKSFESVSLKTDPVDVLIIQDYTSLSGKYDPTGHKQDKQNDHIISFILEKAGFKKAGISYRLTNLLKCRLTEEDAPRGKAPTITVLSKCSPYLMDEIEKIKPKVIISLGTATTKKLGLTKHNNTSNRGEVVNSKYGPVVITFHPKILSFIRQIAKGNAGIWGPDYFNVILRDFQKAIKIIQGTVRKDIGDASTLEARVMEVAKAKVQVATSIKDVRDICAEITAFPPEKIISFDTETTSVDPLDPDLKLLSYQFGWFDDDGKVLAKVIPLYHRKNTFFNPDEAWELIKPILEDPNRVKVGQGSKYDILVTYWAKGVRVRGVKFDTLLIQHSIESGTQKCYGLKALCWDHLLEMGIAGYENLLGDLGALKKLKEKELEAAIEEAEELCSDGPVEVDNE